MCSVDGFTGKQKFTIEQYAAFNADRGPDGTNYWCDENVSIAHSLLTIQNNPNNVSQPVERGDYVMAYNGEIYGIDEFDTDYLMNILIEGDWAKLKYETNGMWAFSLYDKKSQTLTLCRDHLGVKALYWMRHNNEIFWASTPKPLLAVFQETSTLLEEHGYEKSLNFLDGFWLSPETPFYGIRRVPPGGILHFNLKTKELYAEDNLWGSDRTRFNLNPRNEWDPDEYKELTEKALRDVCTAPERKKCISLSGGLDSTLLASLNKHQDNIFCSTISFEPVMEEQTTTRLFHEAALAEKTCGELGLEWTSTEIKRKWQNNGDFEEAVKRIGAFMWLGSRIVPRYRNVKNAAEHGAKIYIVGDLADEILTGYSGHCWYYLGPDEPRSRGGPWINPWLDDTFNLYDKHMTDNGQNHYHQWYPKHLHGTDAVNNHLFWRLMQSVDSFNGLVDNLAGSFGMESRVPYMHQEFVKYVMKIPSHDKLRLPTRRDIRKGHHVLNPPAEQHFDDKGFSIYAGSYKRLIRDEMKEYIPEHVNTATNKVGFSVPWNARNHHLNDQLRQLEAKRAWKVLANEYKF